MVHLVACLLQGLVASVINATSRNLLAAASATETVTVCQVGVPHTLTVKVMGFFSKKCCNDTIGMPCAPC